MNGKHDCFIFEICTYISMMYKTFLNWTIYIGCKI